MLGRGLNCVTSSLMPGLRSTRVCSTDRRDSLSKVSSRRSTERGFPIRLGRKRFRELGVIEGRRALEGAGEVDISSSRSGEGDAFRLRELDVDTVLCLVTSP